MVRPTGPRGEKGEKGDAGEDAITPTGYSLLDSSSTAPAGYTYTGGSVDSQGWRNIADMPNPAWHASAVTYNGKIYVIGGDDGSNPTNLTQIYDPSQNTWSQDSNMLSSRTRFAVAEMDGKIYAFGGHDMTSALSSVEVYDPGLNSWTGAGTTLSSPRSDLAAAMLGDWRTSRKILVMGGERWWWYSTGDDRDLLP